MRTPAASSTRLLRYFGYQVEAVATYESALAALNDSQFQILLCNIGLPDGDGCNLVHQAKSKQRNLVAVALTGRAEGQDIQRAKAAGFDHYLTKPFDAGELRYVLGSWGKATISDDVPMRADDQPEFLKTLTESRSNFQLRAK